MGYVSHHDHALLDFRLSLPQDWARDEQRRQACHVPPEVRYHTRHEQCLEMLDAWGEQVPHGWVTGDDELGRHTRFRDALRDGASGMCWGCPAPRRCVTWRRHCRRIRGVDGRRKPPWQSVTVLAPSPRSGGMGRLDGARRRERAGGHRDGQTPGADAARAQTHGTRGVAGRHPSSPRGRPDVGGKPRGCHEQDAATAISII